MQSLLLEQIKVGGQQNECFCVGFEEELEGSETETGGKQGESLGAIWPVAVQHVVVVVVVDVDIAEEGARMPTMKQVMRRNILQRCFSEFQYCGTCKSQSWETDDQIRS
jgi:hypothetical protein